jgi:hypothetical protein
MNASILVSILIGFLTVSATFASETLDAKGLDTRILFWSLLAVVSIGLCLYKKLLLVIITLGLSIAINLPALWLTTLGLDQDILLATLLIMTLAPTCDYFITRFTETPLTLRQPSCK